MKNKHINLCQPDGEKSCAACCGLYNDANSTRAFLESRLAKRTELFRETKRDIDSIVEYQQRIKRLENVAPIIPEIHICEFTGYLTDDLCTIGCMLHPMAPDNSGMDWRGLCHYGALACKTFFCPSCENLSASHARILTEIIDDWHLYGLVITDVNFCSSVFNYLHLKKNREIQAQEFLKNKKACDYLCQLCSLKAGLGEHLGTNVRQSRYFVKKDNPLGRNALEMNINHIIQGVYRVYNVDDPDCACDGPVKEILSSLGSCFE